MHCETASCILPWKMSFPLFLGCSVALSWQYLLLSMRYWSGSWAYFHFLPASFQVQRIAWHPWTQILFGTGCDKYRSHQWELAWYQLKIKGGELFSLLSGTVRQPTNRFDQELWNIRFLSMLLFLSGSQLDWSVRDPSSWHRLSPHTLLVRPSYLF